MLVHKNWDKDRGKTENKDQREKEGRRATGGKERERHGGRRGR